MEGTKTAVPKTLWFLWFQGLEKAPYVVRKCHESWVAKNPGWQVVTLDDETLPRYASADYYSGNLAMLSLQHRSDLARLDLLNRHGGVWSDATCFCAQPLDDWIWPNVGSGFFAFDQPGPDRMVSTWFLAAEPKNLLVSRLHDRMLAYWGDHPLRGNRKQFKVRALTHLLQGSARTRGLWFSRPIVDWLSIAPYYAVHYAFEKLINDDPECARVWEQTPKVSARPSHRLHEVGLLSPVSGTLRSEIARQSTPVYKTAWNLHDQVIPGGSNLGYLLNG